MGWIVLFKSYSYRFSLFHNICTLNYEFQKGKQGHLYSVSSSDFLRKELHVIKCNYCGNRIRPYLVRTYVPLLSTILCFIKAAIKFLHTSLLRRRIFFSYCHYILFTFIDINTLKKKEIHSLKFSKKRQDCTAG